jgi:stage II sporulation protein P
MTLKQGNEAPQILIYHTHSQEAYADSRPGVVEDTVVGVGEYLTKILKDDYGYNVIHDTTQYDTLDTEKKSRVAYTEALEGLTKDLEKNPSIEVMIDLHRNSGAAKTTMIDGKETAQIMMFNGLCRDQNGPLTNLDNPYLQDNLALSFQIQIKSKEIFPGLFIKNYLKNYRFNMHLRPKSMLVELGTVNNTVESAMNAMLPFAKILDDVLQGE